MLSLQFLNSFSTTLHRDDRPFHCWTIAPLSSLRPMVATGHSVCFSLMPSHTVFICSSCSLSCDKAAVSLFSRSLRELYSSASLRSFSATVSTSASHAGKVVPICLPSSSCTFFMSEAILAVFSTNSTMRLSFWLLFSFASVKRCMLSRNVLSCGLFSFTLSLMVCCRSFTCWRFCCSLSSLVSTSLTRLAMVCSTSSSIAIEAFSIRGFSAASCLSMLAVSFCMPVVNVFNSPFSTLKALLMVVSFSCEVSAAALASFCSS